jgi:hypothetical protein
MRKTKQTNRKLQVKTQLICVSRMRSLLNVNVPTDCVGSRSTSCRGTGLKVRMNRKVREVPDGHNNDNINNN